jgi:hypothetical protein
MLDVIGHLTGLVARQSQAPLLVTFSRRPVPGLLAQVFGPGSAFNLVLAGQEGPLRFGQAFAQREPSADPAEIPLGSLQPRLFGPAAREGAPVIARFVDPATLTRLLDERGGFLRRCAAVIVQIGAEEARGAALRALAGAGHTAQAGLALGSGQSLWVASPEALAYPASILPAGEGRLERLVLLDPCLDGQRGHYLPLARALTAGAQALGAEVAWACHAGLDATLAPAEVLLRPCFARSFFDLPQAEVAGTDLGPEFAPPLAALMEEFAGPGTHMLAHSCDPGMLRAALQRAEAREELPVTLHLCLPNHPWRMPGRAAGIEASRALQRLAATPAWNRQLFLWTETRTLAAQIGQRLGQPVPALPLPAPAWAVGAPLPPAGAAPLCLAFLGEARLDKGFLDLPELAEALDGLAGVRLLIHVLAPPHGFTAEHDAALARLAARPDVTLVPEALDETRYRAMLDAADGVLLPYHPQHYAGRGTGILCDAIAAGRMVVARAGPTMDEHASEGVVLTYDGPAGFRAVVRRILMEREALTARALREAARFRGRRSPAAVVAGLRWRAVLAG